MILLLCDIRKAFRVSNFLLRDPLWNILRHCLLLLRSLLPLPTIRSSFNLLGSRLLRLGRSLGFQIRGIELSDVNHLFSFYLLVLRRSNRLPYMQANLDKAILSHWSP